MVNLPSFRLRGWPRLVAGLHSIVALQPQQIIPHRLDMQPHGRLGPCGIAGGDGADIVGADDDRRQGAPHQGADAQPAPGRLAAHGIEAIEDRQQQLVVRRLGHRPVQRAVPQLPGLGVPGAVALLQQALDILDLRRRGAGRRQPRDQRLEQQADLQHLLGLVMALTRSRPVAAWIGRGPTKVPLPTWRQIRPSASRISSPSRKPLRLTPSSPASSRSGGRRLWAGYRPLSRSCDSFSQRFRRAGSIRYQYVDWLQHADLRHLDDGCLGVQASMR